MAITLKENMLRFMKFQEPEYLPLYGDFHLCAPSALAGEAGTGTAENPVGIDWFGRRWIFDPAVRASNPDVNRPLIDDITEWRDVFHFPDLDTIVDWEACAAKDTAGWDRENRPVRCIIGSGPWEQLNQSMNFMDALCALMEEPEACYEFMGAIADYKIQIIDRVVKYYKPDVICMHDDYGTGQALFMAPEVWRQLVKPHLKKIVDYVQSQGIIYQHHNCGYMASIVDEMIDDLGITSWQSVHMVNEPLQLCKTLKGRMSLMGGLVDAQALDGIDVSEETIRNMMIQAIDLLYPTGAQVIVGPWTPAHPERTAYAGQVLVEHAQKYFKNRRPA